MAKTKTLSHEIVLPEEDDECDAERPMHMPGVDPDPNCPSKLCGVVNGKVVQSGYLYEILIRCKQGIWQNTDQTKPNFINNDFVTQCSASDRLSIPVNETITSKDWNTSGFGDVLCFGNATYVDNTMMAVACFFGGTEDATVRHFKAKWLGEDVTCSSKLAAKAAPPVAAARAIASEPMFYPSQSDGDWLLYENLPVSAIGNGNLLSRHGEPLRASLLAVSAARVYWWKNPLNSSVVRRPVGELVPSGVSSPFRGLPRNAIVIHQPRHRHVLVSECRDKPDLIDLDRNQDFRIKVNFESPVIPTAGLVDGSYDLWVKVID